jgi:signal peptidase I
MDDITPSSTQPQPQATPSPAPLIPDSGRPERHSRGGAIREALSLIGVLVTALAVALCLIAFVFQSYQVDGPSMQNTLQNANRLIVWKLPRTWARITGHTYIPKRGDIVVFTQSGLAAYGQQDTKQLIKRVIGLPGDRLVVKNNAYTIYNKQYPNGFDPDKTLPYHAQITEVTTGNQDITLGKDQIFVSGDNRTNSLDSRSFGPINASQIVGKLAVRVLPLSESERF